MGMEAGEKTRLSFGRRLRAFREAAGISAEEMGRRLKIHPHSVYRLERGDQWVGADVLERIGEELSLDLARLFTDAAPAVTWQEALGVIARELESIKETPARDPRAERIAKLGPSELKALDLFLNGMPSLTQEANQKDRKPPEKGK